MPMSSKKGYIEVKNYAHVKQEVVTWRSKTMPMTNKKWLHRSQELCPCQARSGYMEV